MLSNSDMEIFYNHFKEAFYDPYLKYDSEKEETVPMEVEKIRDESDLIVKKYKKK